MDIVNLISVLIISWCPCVQSSLLAPLPDPQVGKSVLGPRTFATVWELLWFNCSQVYRLSTWWLYGGAHVPRLPGLQQPEPLSPPQAPADSCICRRCSNTQRLVWLSFLWVLVCTSFCLSPLSISGLCGVWFQMWFSPSSCLVRASPFPLDVAISFWWDSTFSCQWLFSG